MELNLCEQTFKAELLFHMPFSVICFISVFQAANRFFPTPGVKCKERDTPESRLIAVLPISQVHIFLVTAKYNFCLLDMRCVLIYTI